MGINRAENSLENRQTRALVDLQRTSLELKTKTQQIGADVVAVQGIPEGGADGTGSITLATNSAATMNVTVTPANATLTLWNFLFDVRVDTNDYAYQFPNGSSLTTAQRQLRLYSWISWGDSSDTTNIRTFKVRVENYDTVSHTYYLTVRAYIPKLAGSS